VFSIVATPPHPSTRGRLQTDAAGGGRPFACCERPASSSVLRDDGSRLVPNLTSRRNAVNPTLVADGV
jgi:hypothetical protein